MMKNIKTDLERQINYSIYSGRTLKVNRFKWTPSIFPIKRTIDEHLRVTDSFEKVIVWYTNWNTY